MTNIENAADNGQSLGLFLGIIFITIFGLCVWDQFFLHRKTTTDRYVPVTEDQTSNPGKTDSRKTINTSRHITSVKQVDDIPAGEFEKKFWEFYVKMAKKPPPVFKPEFKVVEEGIYKYYLYIVRKGDCLESICYIFGADPVRTKKLNHLCGDIVVLGQTLKIPKISYPVFETVASNYGYRDIFKEGKVTSSGRKYNRYVPLIALRGVPNGQMVLVFNLDNPKIKPVLLKKEDSGPYLEDNNGNYIRGADVSAGGSVLLGFFRKGTAHVRIVVLGPEFAVRGV